VINKLAFLVDDFIGWRFPITFVEYLDHYDIPLNRSIHIFPAL